MHLQSLTGQVLRHQVSGVGRTLDLHESNPLSRLHLLQPKGPDIKVSDLAYAVSLDDAQRCRCIYMQSGGERQPKVLGKSHATKGFRSSTYNRQQFGLGTALGDRILGFRPRSHCVSP